jgi:riboflavin synthase
VFTGIVEEMGRVVRVTRSGGGLGLHISAREVLVATHIGDSMAVNGVCLTVTGLGAGGFSAQVMPETVNRTTLGSVAAGDWVNLERARQIGGRLGGHLVTGHIDGLAEVVAVRSQVASRVLRFRAPSQCLRYVVPKGSITLDGVSLTVAENSGDTFAVALIPHTMAHTTLGRCAVGARVNFESDLIGKYVDRLLGSAAPSSGVTEQFLKKVGFWE